MSWSIDFIGTTDSIIVALKEHSTKIQDFSKIEYDAVLPHLISLVKQNFNVDLDPTLRITANGHSYGRQYQQCFVSIQPEYASFV